MTKLLFSFLFFFNTDTFLELQFNIIYIKWHNNISHNCTRISKFFLFCPLISRSTYLLRKRRNILQLLFPTHFHRKNVPTSQRSPHRNDGSFQDSDTFSIIIELTFVKTDTTSFTIIQISPQHQRLKEAKNNKKQYFHIQTISNESRCSVIMKKTSTFCGKQEIRVKAWRICPCLSCKVGRN